VWQAITDKEQMKHWYFDMPDFEPVAGTEFSFVGTDHDCKDWVHLCRVTEVVPLKKLSHTWRYEGVAGESTVTWELFEEGTNTRVKLTHAGLETFPPVKTFARESFAEGWTYIVGEALKDEVEMQTIRRNVVVNANPERVWTLITDNDSIKQWASAFLEGTYVETEGQIGDIVVWKDAAGNTAVKGKVVAREEYKMFKIGYWDSVEETEDTPLGKYVESFIITERNGGTALSVSSGPLLPEHAATHAPLWDKALINLRELAEKQEV
jgi:uncharacterized protein YndB with AHSA1/START domain